MMEKFSIALLLFFLTTNLQAAESEMRGQETQLITECEYCTQCIIAIHNELERLIEGCEPVTEECIEIFYTHNLTSHVLYFDELERLISHLTTIFVKDPFYQCFLGNLLAFSKEFKRHSFRHVRKKSLPHLLQYAHSDTPLSTGLQRRHSHSGLPRSPLSRT